MAKVSPVAATKHASKLSRLAAAAKCVRSSLSLARAWARRRLLFEVLTAGGVNRDQLLKVERESKQRV